MDERELEDAIRRWLTPQDRMAIVEDLGLGFDRSIPGAFVSELSRRANALFAKKIMAGAIVGAPADPEAFA